MRLLVVNCNTSRSMTESIGRTARMAACPGTDIVADQPSWGPSSAEGYYESFISAAAVLDLLTRTSGGYDGVVMAGFGEHGREGARQLLNVPVVDITEAAGYVACLLGRRFAVLTTVVPAIGPIEDSLSGAGIAGRCAGVRALNSSVLDVLGNGEEIVARAIEAGNELIAAGADVLILGCAGFNNLESALEQHFRLPVIDGVKAAVGLCETLVRLGKTTSKTGSYARPSARKARPGWPVGERPESRENQGVSSC